MTEIIDWFGTGDDSEHGFLSNFFMMPGYRVNWAGRSWASVEHAYQAAKTLDPTKVQMIEMADTPRSAKRYGRRVELRPDWEQVKLSIMSQLLRRKFAYRDLAELLLGTGDALLVEGNHWGDWYWGAVPEKDLHRCPDWCQSFPICGSNELLYGQNMLGTLLIQLRAELKIEHDFLHSTKGKVP